MKIEDFLSPANAIIGMNAANKARLLKELSERAAASLHVDPEQIAAEIMKREALGSTGMGQGIAIPHARFQEMDKPFGVFVRLKKAIEYDAVDGKPVDLVFLLLLPPATQSDQLNALAAVARNLREPERLQKLRAAEDAAALYRELTL